MIKYTDVFNINFYKKEIFHGSWKQMRYHIQQSQNEDDSTALLVTIWPGPYNFAATDDSLKRTAVFEFSNDGLKAAVDYLNEQYPSFC